MREIKFRIPVVCQNGHKGYWHYRIDSGSDFAKTTDSQPPKNICKCPKTRIGEGWSRAGADEQYTGLKDKNGREIYEGDILLIPDGHTEPVLDDGSGPKMPFNHLAPVTYRDDLAVFMVQISHSGDLFGRGLCDFALIKSEGVRFEVIGNIYENTELLEVSQ